MTQQINRRTVTKGIAWSVPAVALASAAPAFASSKDGPLTLSGTACKIPGASNDGYKHGYLYELTVKNELGGNPGNAVIVIESVTVDGVAQDQIGVKYHPSSDKPSAVSCGCMTIPTNKVVLHSPDGYMSHKVLLYTNSSTDSSNSNVAVKYTVYDCDNDCAARTYTATAQYADSPPVNGAKCTIPGKTPVLPAEELITYGTIPLTAPVDEPLTVDSDVPEATEGASSADDVESAEPSDIEEPPADSVEDAPLETLDEDLDEDKVVGSESSGEDTE